MLLFEVVNITYHVQLCNSVQNMFFTCFSSKRVILSDCCMCASSTTTSFHRTSVMLLEIVLQCILDLGLRQCVSKAVSPFLFIIHVCQMLSVFTLKDASVSNDCVVPFLSGTCFLGNCWSDISGPQSNRLISYISIMISGKSPTRKSFLIWKKLPLSFLMKDSGGIWQSCAPRYSSS